jgi:hypothetical protein
MTTDQEVQKIIEHIGLLASVIDYRVDDNGMLHVEIDPNSVSKVFDDEELLEDEDEDA